MMTAAPRQADQNAIAEAAAHIRAGRLVAMPTETVYGLAADATNDRACAAVFEAKGRPRFNPLIVHVADVAMAARYADVPPLAEKLAAAFWPGALTLVVPRKAGADLSLLASAGLDTVALRTPAHAVAQDLIAAAGAPLAAPSANPSGAVSPTTAAHVAEGLGDKVAMILDAGPCRVGVESTILGIEGDRARLLRPGGLARAEIEAVAGPLLAPLADQDKPQAPGALQSHYAPRAKVRLNAKNPLEGEAFLGFGSVARQAPNALNLSPTGDLAEAAANLFAFLRRLDNQAATIAIAPIPQHGLGEAINDRLSRAAAPRPTLPESG
ncbi:MAG: L-threonylcarbamoyladenylate synthase [Pseudomonadota bacterium]